MKIEWRSKVIMVLSLVFLAASISLFSAEAIDRAQAAGGIEYKVVPIKTNIGTEDLQRILDNMGKEGWSLVTIGGFSNPAYFIFRK